jgi:uncharacterized iron-regulated protein
MHRRPGVSVLALCLLGSWACGASRTGGAASVAPALAPENARVVRSPDGQGVSFAELVAAAARADVVYFGEQHDDPETHFTQFALLDAIGRARANVVLSLEMFERDVQPLLDDYLRGGISEADFLSRSRPWDRYATDYRPLVVLARARGWPVIAANVPRPIASAVSRKGLAALDTLPSTSRSHAARDIQCPKDAYYDLFAEQMKGHGGPGSADTASMRAMTDRFYEAQCIKDETMAESVASALSQHPDAIVVHVNGAFHSDRGLGTVSRVDRREPSRTRIVITAIPVADPRTEPAGPHTGRADFVIFTRKLK